MEVDPQRVKQNTVSLTQKQQVQYDMADKIELTKVHGYNVNQLMSDMRYRLSAALNQAGVGSTDYAKHVMSYLSKRE